MSISFSERSHLFTARDVRGIRLGELLAEYC